MTLFAGPDRRQKVLVLLTMAFALFMAMLDNTVVNVALPTLTRELGAGVSQLQWIVDGYVLAFASLLLTGGILGDRYGRKRIFLMGLVIFTLASLLCGLSQSSAQLIAFRALQGVGAGFLMPGTLSILTVTFPPSERAKAIGIWAGVSAFALALGPTLGGWMIEHVGWESVFFLNVPIGVTGLVVAALIVKESKAPEARRLDVPGLVLGTAGLFAITFGLIEANQQGWSSPVIIASLTVGVALLGAFLRWEHHTPHAMFPLTFFRIPAFSAGNLVAFSVSLGMFGTFFFFSLYMQLIRGYSAFQAGVRFLPMTVMIIFMAPTAGRIASRYGSRWPMTAGLSMAATGLFIMGFVEATTPFWMLIPLFVLMGAGMGMTMTPMTAAVMNAVGSRRAGLGSATTNTSREVGGVFGIALLGALLTTKLKSSLTASLGALALPLPLREAILETAGHGRFDPSVLRGLPPETVLQLQAAFGDAFMDGFRIALYVAAGVLGFAALVSMRFIPSGAPQDDEGGVSADGQPLPAVAH